MGEIEARLHQHPQVGNAAVITGKDTLGNQQLVAYIAPKQGQNPTPQEIRDFLKEKLPEYMLPASFVLLDVLPLTPS